MNFSIWILPLLLIILILMLVKMINSYVNLKRIYNDKRFIEIDSVVTDVQVYNSSYSLARVRICGITSPIFNKVYEATINYTVNGKQYFKKMKRHNVVEKGDLIKIKVNENNPDDIYITKLSNIGPILMTSFMILSILILIIVSLYHM